jgi:hypothetical protein
MNRTATKNKNKRKKEKAVVTLRADNHASFKPKTTKLIFAVSPLCKQHERLRPMID